MGSNPTRPSSQSPVIFAVRTTGLAAARGRPAAGRERFYDLIFLENVAGLASGEISRWNDRLRAAREAFQVSKEHTAWLATLYGIAFSDATGVRFAQDQAKQKLYDVTGSMPGAMSGLGWLAGQVVLQQQASTRKQFEGLASQIRLQISRNLRAISEDEIGLDPLPDALLHVEEVADALATEEVGKKAAALLYGYLLEVPDEYWAREDDEFDPQDHKEEIAARLEVVSAAARGSGCLGSLVALMALLGVGLGIPITLAFWLAI